MKITFRQVLKATIFNVFH